MAKTIEQYKADYAAAKAAGNAAAMQAANNGANAIRASQGVAAEYATADIAKTAAKNTTPTPPVPTPTKTHTSSVAGVGASNAAQQSILDAMAANSEAWHKASAAEKARLEAQNKNYANQLGALGLNLGFDSGSGMWSGVATTQAPTAGNVTNPGLNGLPLGDVYGLTYDYDKILGLLNKATTDAYAARETEAKQTENTFYRNMVDTQSATLDTLRQTQAAAVATGASKGIAAAQELSAILGMQEEAGVGATDLANARLNLSEKKQAEMSQNASGALDTSNAIKQAIANMDLTKYGYDVQKLMGDLDYLASLYNSDKTLDGVKYNADKNLQGTQYATDNQPKYNSSSGGGWNGGTPTAPTEDKAPTAPTEDKAPTPTTSETGVRLSAQNIDAAIKNGGGVATLTGTPYMVKADGNGTYTISDGSGNEGASMSGLTWQQLQKVQNNRDIDAAKPSYGKDSLLSALQGKQIIASGGKFTWDKNSGVWRSNTTPPKEIYRFTPGTVEQEDVDAIMARNPTAVTRKNADGTFSVLASKPEDGKKTEDVLSFVRQGAIPNGMKITLGGATKYTYDAQNGVWRSNLAGGISMNTMIGHIQKASTIQVG